MTKLNQKSLLKFLLLFAFVKSRISLLVRHCEANRRFAKAIQNKNQSRDSATLKASSGAGVGVVREGEGSDFAIQAPTPSLKENAHSQKGDSNADLSAESRKEMDSRFALDSRYLDCHDSTTNLKQNFRHTERSEVSKSRKSNQVQNAMTQERMGESHRFAQSKKIIGDSKVAKMDSSLRTSCYAQNDEMVDCFGNESLRNDDIFDSTIRSRNHNA